MKEWERWTVAGGLKGGAVLTRIPNYVRSMINAGVHSLSTEGSSYIWRVVVLAALSFGMRSR
jgi:hypothetical protein